MSEERIHKIRCDQCGKEVELGVFDGVSSLISWFRLTTPPSNKAILAEREAYDLCSSVCLGEFLVKKGWIEVTE